ncbi:MAG: HDOD domain-containing protein, partial [Candidatus Caenarcaniphilales bacterium]|nr:HDOD domain-containing protein [Candidatus Caenarcaniphilales bacterium]
MGTAINGIAAKIKELDGLGSLSPVAVELINIIDKPKTKIEEIESLVKLDKVLYANVFKYLKSAAFGLRRVPTNIEEAIHYLGLHGLRDLIFLLASRKFFSGSNNWAKSVFVAFAARKIANRLSLHPNISSNIYSAALMYDLGFLVLLKRN